MSVLPPRRLPDRKRFIFVGREVEDLFYRIIGIEEGVESLLQQLADCKLYIATLTEQIAEYTRVINDKIRQFGVRIDAHARFGQAVVRETEAWREMTRVNQQTLESLDALFDPDNPVEEVFDFPADEYEPFAIR